MERSIGCKMAEVQLEPIKGYNCTKSKTAIYIYLKSGFCGKKNLQIPTDPHSRPFNVFE